MKINQQLQKYRSCSGGSFRAAIDESADLVLTFGSRDILKNPDIYPSLRARYPKASLCGCSTAGEILNTRVFDNTLVSTAISFDHTRVVGAGITLDMAADSVHAGALLARSIAREGLVHVFVLSDGLNVNGSDLVKGLTENLPDGVTVTGGLAADSDRFEETYVFCDNIPRQNSLAIIGFYGDRLKVGYGSMGGWDPFGPDRLVTRSSENVLYDLDGKSALELYKKYLGDMARELPASALLFPLCIRTKENETGIVRTILSVNDDENSMTFAGDIPEGSYARFMKANSERLIDGAYGAVMTGHRAMGDSIPAELTMLISCVGRKLVLKQRVEEEVETSRDILGPDAAITGFYSYGEISPFTPGAKCALHNQTMTVTTMAEV